MRAEWEAAQGALNQATDAEACGARAMARAAQGAEQLHCYRDTGARVRVGSAQGC